MHYLYAWLILGLWTVWLGYWFIAAIGTKQTATEETIRSRLLHSVPLLIGVWLLSFNGFPGTWLNARFLPRSPAWFWLGAAMVAAGLVWSLSARRHLGGNWSATVTVKQGHELIRTGPYRWTRHPIYTGLLAAIAGSAVAQGECRSLLALLLIIASVLRKAGVEERFMTRQFPGTYPEVPQNRFRR